MNTHQGALKVRMDTCAADGILTGTCGQEHIFFTEHIFFQPKTQATTPDRKLALGSIPRLLWSEMGPPLEGSTSPLWGAAKQAMLRMVLAAVQSNASRPSAEVYV